MEKEPRPTRASRSRRAAIGTFIFLIVPVACFYLATAGSTSANLKVLRFETNEMRVFAILQLTNVGPGTITYVGFETNEAPLNFRFQTPAGFMEAPWHFYSGVEIDWGHSLRQFKLRAHESVNLPVLIDYLRQDYQVAMRYTVPTAPGPLDWLRHHTPPRISHWLYGSPERTVLSSLIKTNSQFFR